MIDKYLTEIRKLVTHGLRGEAKKVRLYAEQLAKKVEEEGLQKEAGLIRSSMTESAHALPGVAPAFAPGPVRPSPVDSESRCPVADESRPCRGEVDLFLPAGVRQTVERFVAFTRAGARFAAEGVAVNPSLIVHGPPGCGKTQLAKWVAAELGRPLLTARVDAIVSSYLGSTSKNVRNLFDHAVRSGAVLLLDEFDALGKMRDDDRELGELKRVVISLLQNIDAAGPDLVLIAATNHEHLLDPAVWRRFSFKARLGPPDFDARKAILTRALRSFAPPHGVEVLAAMTEGHSGAAIKQGAEDGVRAAILADRPTAQPEDLVASAISAQTPDQPPPTDRDALVRLVADRAEGRVTHKQVAEFFGVSQSTVSKACSKGRGGT